MSKAWLPVNFDGIPQNLRDAARWLLWDASGDHKKKPYHAKNPAHPVDPNDSANWSDYTVAQLALNTSGMTGLGFALGADNDVHFSGIDLDNCVDPKTDHIERWADDVIRRINSYTEFSPSGTGVKIFVVGSLPVGAKQGKQYKIEIYDHDRYFAVTGHHFPGTPTHVDAREAELRALYKQAYSPHLRDRVTLLGHYRREDSNWIFIRCPWAHEHTTPDGDRDAALHVTDGTVDGFQCFHGHCQDRKLPDVLRLFGIAERGNRALRLTYASEITPRPTRWLWEDRLPLGSFTLNAGREGIGKTTLSYTLGADITKGRLPGACFGHPRTVIVAATEDSWEHTIVPRLMAADADLTRVARVDVTTSDGVDSWLQLPRDNSELLRVVRETEAVLIILDPLISRLASKLDTHKDADVRQALEPLVHLADKTGAVVMGIIHVNKGASRDPLNMVMGSRAFTAVARAVLFVAENPEKEDTRVLGQPKNNLGRCDLPTRVFSIENKLVGTTVEGQIFSGKLKWEGETDRTIREIVEEQSDSSTDHSAVREAVDWLADYLKQQHGLAESALLKAEGKRAGHSESTLKRARKKLRVRTESAGFPRKTWWLMPGVNVDLNALADAAAVEEKEAAR